MLAQNKLSERMYNQAIFIPARGTGIKLIPDIRDNLASKRRKTRPARTCISVSWSNCTHKMLVFYALWMLE